MEQRKHVRYCVLYAGSLSVEGIRAKGVILDLSVAGCRTRSPVPVKTGESLGLLIDVLRYDILVEVILATVC